MNVQTISLDLCKQTSILPVVIIGQADVSGTTIKAKIFDNGAAANLEDMTAMFEMRLPDGKTYVRDSNCTIDGNEIMYTVDEEHCAAVEGFTDECYFDILDGPSVVYSTARFRVVILRSAHNASIEAMPWDTEVDALIERGEDFMDYVEQYGIPLMSASVRGGAKLGSGLDITDEVLSVDITPGDIGAYTTAETDAAIAASAARAYKAAGSVTFANLPRTLTASMQGYVYNVEDSFTIDSSVQAIFVEQSGTFPAGTNVCVIDTDTTGTNPTYKYDVIAGFVDLSGYSQVGHVHAATDITSGQLAIANGGTGASTAAGAATAIVDGQAIQPASVAATGAISAGGAISTTDTITATGAITGGSIGDSTGTLAQLRESVSQTIQVDRDLPVHFDPYANGMVLKCEVAGDSTFKYRVIQITDSKISVYKRKTGWTDTTGQEYKSVNLT